MTTDQRLINLTSAAAASRLIAEDVRSEALSLIERYMRACSLSRGADKGRAAFWTDKALGLTTDMHAMYQRLTGRDYRGVCEDIDAKGRERSAVA